MSNIYISEPPTNGKVVMNTTFGDLDIELWTKECPLACRNFIQLCMENYYDGIIFHRIIKGFIAQSGDPTGTGMGGDSVYGHPFKDEFHSRLRFVRAGLVAMANAGPNDNGSQFFITLGTTPDLQNKHTIFGKITGDTKFNMLKLNEMQTDMNDRPIQPPKIRSTKILLNPFTDIIPRPSRTELLEAAKNESIISQQKKNSANNSQLTKKSLNLLSFGDEEEEGDMDDTIQIKTGSKSSHDLLIDDPTLLKKSVIDLELERANAEENNNLIDMVATNRAADKDNKFKDNAKVDSLKQKIGSLATNKTPSTNENIDEIKDDLTTHPVKPNKLQALKHISDKNDGEIEYASELTKEALLEYVDANRVYKERKNQLPKKGHKREQQTLSLLTDFRARMLEQKTKLLDEQKQKYSKKKSSANNTDIKQNADFSHMNISSSTLNDNNILQNRGDDSIKERVLSNQKTVDNQYEVHYKKIPKSRRVKEAIMKQKNLTELYPELAMWEDIADENKYTSTNGQYVNDNDSNTPLKGISEIAGHAFVCSDREASSSSDTDGSFEGGTYPPGGVNANEILTIQNQKKKKKQFLEQVLAEDNNNNPDKNGNAATDDVQSKTSSKKKLRKKDKSGAESGDSDSATEDWFLLKKTRKDACSINPAEFYDIDDPRNPINVRRREGDGTKQRPTYAVNSNSNAYTQQQSNYNYNATNYGAYDRTLHYNYDYYKAPPNSKGEKAAGSSGAFGFGGQPKPKDLAAEKAKQAERELKRFTGPFVKPFR